MDEDLSFLGEGDDGLNGFEQMEFPDMEYTPAPEESSEQAPVEPQVDSTPVAESTDSDLKKQLEETRNELALLREQIAGKQEESPKKLEPYQFIANEDLHSAMLVSKDSANEVFNNVYNVMEQRLMQIVEPQMLQTATRVMTQEMFRREFYEANKDLKGFEPIVREVALEVARTDPNLSVQDAFKRVAEISRARTGGNKTQSNAGRPAQTRNPGFAGNSGARGPAGVPNSSGPKSLVDQIAELVS